MSHTVGVAEPHPEQLRRPRLGSGQVALAPAESIVEPDEQVRRSYRFSDPALSELPLDQLLDELLDRVQEALDVDTVAILLLDEEAGELVARAAKGIEEEVERGVRIPLGQGFAGRIAGERVAIFIADVDHADILNPILREKGIRSLLGVPLIVEGNLIGVMHVGSLHPRTFGQERSRRAPARRGPRRAGDRAGHPVRRARARAQRLDGAPAQPAAQAAGRRHRGGLSRLDTSRPARRWAATGTT